MQIGLSLGLTRLGGNSLTAQALAILRSYGTDAHMWLPGVGYVGGLDAANYVESTGSGAAAVDGPVGYVGDAGKALGPERVLNGDFSNGSTNWAFTQPTSGSVGVVNGRLRINSLDGTQAQAGTAGYNPCTVGLTYLITFDAEVVSGLVNFRNNGGVFIKSVVNGPNSLVWKADSAQVHFARGASCDVYIDNFSIKELVGAIPATQSTTAAKPILRQSGGRYSWQFDGVDDRLDLSAVPFQQADDHCVIAACVANAYNDAAIFCIRNTASTAGIVALLRVNTLGLVQGIWRNDASSITRSPSAPTVVGIGVPFVACCRKSGSGYTARRNGVASANETGAPGATTVNTATIGASVSTTASNFVGGNIGPVIAIKGTVSDADLLTLERWVGSMSGVTIA